MASESVKQFKHDCNITDEDRPSSGVICGNRPGTASPRVEGFYQTIYRNLATADLPMVQQQTKRS